MLRYVGTQWVLQSIPAHLGFWTLSGGFGLGGYPIHQRSSIEGCTSGCTWTPLEVTILTSTGENFTPEKGWFD